jgi:hypothetical protein
LVDFEAPSQLPHGTAGRARYLLLTSSPVHATGNRLERPLSSLVTGCSVVSTVTFSSASMSDGWQDLH